MPRVTVIIPTYNYARVLPYSIRSVLRQTFSDFELLVIGDHCTDESESVVRAVEDPRVRWINLEKGTKHQSGPNNEGLRQGRGELAAYLGHDDLWLPKHLELAVANIDGGADLSYGMTEMVEVGDVAPHVSPRELEYEPGMWIPPTSVVHRREMALKLGGWTHWCDVQGMDSESDLWMRIHGAGGKVRMVRMLTAVKFPAQLRKDVYAERPTHEQEAWTKRIESEPDFVAVELAKMVKPEYRRGISFRESAGEFAKDILKRVKKRLWWLGLYSKPEGKKTRVQEFEDWREFKGIK